MNDQSDNIYKSKIGAVKPFEFNREVTQVFDDMIRRSVPGYAQVLRYLPTLVRTVLKKMPTAAQSQRYYDLGCSLGAGLAAMAEGVDRSLVTKNAFNFIGLDNSAPMITQAQSLLEPVFDEYELSLELSQQDVLKHKFLPADLVLLNFTLQFIELQKRDALIGDIYTALQPGGYLVLSEKLKFEQPLANDLLTEIHHQFKSDQGYSDLEISQKRDAIDNVLIPETLDDHERRLRAAGFKVVTPWLQNMQFVSILAVK